MWLGVEPHEVTELEGPHPALFRDGAWSSCEGQWGTPVRVCRLSVCGGGLGPQAWPDQ